MIGSAALAGPACRWRIAPPPPAALARELADLHPVVVRALARRGLTAAADARAFLDGAPPDDDPYRLAGMAPAVRRLRRAIDTGEVVVVYGDFDADGVTATALLVLTLRRLGAHVRWYIPHRQEDGYGVHDAALTRLAAEGARVVVTVDCGIRAVDEVAAAARAGLDVIVTDHHVLPEALPEAVAVINPRRPDCGYGFDGFAGVGLAYKLAQALLEGEGHDAAEGLLDLVAIGTIADIVPLVGENRALVLRGLAALGTARRPGVRALFRAAGLDPARLSARSVAFGLAPRLNAAGRMADAGTALELLLATDDAQADRLAGELEARNRSRREATDVALAGAEAALRGRTDDPFLLHADESTAYGVLGLVAGRLAERHYRPAAVVRVDGDEARGSARSIPELDISAALDAAADLLVRYGGHARAAGFTVRTRDLEALRRRLAGHAALALAGRDLRPTLDVDAEVQAADLDLGLCRALDALEPFGEGNPAPLCVLADAVVAGRRVVGTNHLKFVVEGGPGVGSLDAIAFGQAGRAGTLGARADVVFALGLNHWGGTARLELKVVDWGPPGTAAAAATR